MIQEGEVYLSCKDEQSFKQSYIRKELPVYYDGHKIFCIETEETVAGFPDVMELLQVNSELHAFFYEFKYADKSGKIKFQPTQPSFYKRNTFMKVLVVAFNPRSAKVHEFLAEDIFKEDSPYKINLKAEINLNEVEKKLDESISSKS